MCRSNTAGPQRWVMSQNTYVGTFKPDGLTQQATSKKTRVLDSYELEDQPLNTFSYQL